MFSFKKIFQSKLIFIPPKKSKILIYDYHSVSNGSAKILFKNKNKEVFFCRYEQLNLYVLFKSIFFPKYNNIRDSYKYHYLKCVSPKVVYTAIDTSIAFYLLKDLYPNATYIADQESMRDNSFYNDCLEKKNKNIKLKCDYFFSIGNYEKNRIKKIIDTKVIALGSTKNNFFFKKEKRTQKKRIVYISSKIRLRPVLEKRIFSYLLKFCKKYNYKLFFLDRTSVKNDIIFINNKSYLEEIFGRENWKYLQIKNYKKKIDFLANSELVTFMHSTLGYECLVNGFKTFSFRHDKYNFSGQLKVKKKGPFWCKTKNYNIIEKKLLKILATKKSTWNKIVNKQIKNILIYKKNNLEKLEIINKALKQ